MNMIETGPTSLDWMRNQQCERAGIHTAVVSGTRVKGTLQEAFFVHQYVIKCTKNYITMLYGKMIKKKTVLVISSRVLLEMDH